MPDPKIAARICCALLSAAAYQLATNPYLLALVLVLTGHWRAGVAILAVFLVLCALSVSFGVHRRSTFEPFLPIFTAPAWLFIFGNEQEGQDPLWYFAKHPTWPRWLRAFVFCAWRNKLRNLPFVSWLAWLHRPAGRLEVRARTIAGVTFRIRWRGWMTELEWFTADYFGDVGPRLDQPDQWGGVSWAFRPWGRV